MTDTIDCIDFGAGEAYIVGVSPIFKKADNKVVKKIARVFWCKFPRITAEYIRKITRSSEPMRSVYVIPANGSVTETYLVCTTSNRSEDLIAVSYDEISVRGKRIMQQTVDLLKSADMKFYPAHFIYVPPIKRSISCKGTRSSYTPDDLLYMMHTTDIPGRLDNIGRQCEYCKHSMYALAYNHEVSKLLCGYCRVVHGNEDKESLETPGTARAQK
jgi:hypothetical protein